MAETETQHKRIRTEELLLSKIAADLRCQPRDAVNFTVASEYANEMREGAVFPPVVVFHDGEHYWLADGFHRIDAAKSAKLVSFPARVHEGTVRDAILYSCSANASHGLKRSNADKRNAVLKLLHDAEWARWNDTRIATKCQVSVPLVAQIRGDLSSKNLEDSTRLVERGGTVYPMQTASMGEHMKRPPPPTWANEPEPTEADFKGEMFRSIRLFISKIAGLSSLPPAALLDGAEGDLAAFKDLCAEARRNLKAIEGAIR